MKKFFAFVAAVAFAGSMMAATSMTCAEAATAALSVSGNNVEYNDGEEIEVTGYVTGIKTAYSDQYHNISFWMADVADGGEVLQAFRAACATEADAPAVGDLVKVTGKLTKYNSTPEFAAACTYVILQGATPAPKYYVAGSMNGWGANEAYELVANPAVEGEYMGEFTFAANDEFKVTYSDGNTIDDANWFPSGMNNNYKITEAGDYTVTFNPAGNVEGWYEGYFQVLKKEVPVLPVYTCAQVQANQATETGELNEVQVLFVNGGQFYVRDASGMTLIYKSNHGLAIGNLVSGIVGTSTLYSNVTPQFQPSNAAADWTITQGAAPVYDEKAVAPVTTDINGVYNFINVVFAEDVEFTTASKGSAVTATIGEENISIFNNYKKAYSFEANKAYDVVGVVTVYQNNPQVYFVSAAKHTATAIDNAAIETKAIKRIENGKLVIIKNGVRYDAQGIRF